MTCKNALMMTAVSMALLAGSAYAHEKMDVGAKIAEMKAEIGLTDEQARMVRPVLEEFNNKMERIEKDKEMRLSHILSPEQMHRMKEMKREHEK